MDLIEAIVGRKSIRGYKPDPVPKAVIAEILAAALRTPSPVNVQPWEITVMTGAALDKLKEANVELSRSGATPSEFATYGPHVGVYRQRQVDLAIQIFQILGIGREDKDKRVAWAEKGSRFFDAPVAIIISVDEAVSNNAALFSVGSITQTIVLAALQYGLGTCIEGQGVMFPDAVRQITGIPASKRIIVSIALGYPDYDFPVNELRSKRETLGSTVTWCGFES